MKLKYLSLLTIVIIITVLGCEHWYPVYDDFLCTIKMDGTELKYIRRYYGSFLLSPDRETLVESYNNKLYSVDMDDFTTKELILEFENPRDFRDPSISNTKVVYVYKNDINTLDLEDKDTTRLTYTGYSNIKRRPVFSSDGEKIAFPADNDSIASIIMMNNDGTNTETIYTVEAHGISKLYFAQNDEKIIYDFAINPDYGQSGTYCIKIDGTDNHLILDDHLPGIDVSPSTNSIIYPYSGSVYKLNLLTGSSVVLANSRSDYIPVFSPNGEKILYRYDGTYIMNADGSGKYKLTDKTSRWQLNYRPYFINNDKILLTFEKQIN